MHLKHLIRITLAALLMFTAPAVKHAQAVEDAIIAIVNDEVITLRDLRDYIRTTYVGLVAQGYPEDRIKEVMLDLEINGINKLIEDKLMLSKANELGLEVSEDAVNERVDRVKQRYTSEEEFTQSLINHGANITDLRNKIQEQLKIKYVVDYAIRSKIYVNPKAVTDYYSENKSRFMKNEQRVLDSIFIPFEDDAAAAKAKAKEAISRIDAGEDFSTVATDLSIAPPIGRVEKGQLMPDIEQKVFDLSEGEITGIIELENGIYIIKVSDIIEAHIADLAEVTDDIKNILMGEKFKAKFDKWLDELKSEAYIEIKD